MTIYQAVGFVVAGFVTGYVWGAVAKLVRDFFNGYS